MRISEPKFGEPKESWGKDLVEKLYRALREIAGQLNGLSEGRISQRYTAATAAPSTGQYTQGDIVWHKTPTELGGAGSKYVIIGWVNVSTTSTPSFKEMRCLTGN